jgi:hypothetical protein
VGGPIEGDQRGAIDFLGDPATRGVESVERIETHGNLVFLAETTAFKIKGAVRFDYMDFSTRRIPPTAQSSRECSRRTRPLRLRTPLPRRSTSRQRRALARATDPLRCY